MFPMRVKSDQGNRRMTFYLVDDIEQGTSKWLAWRRGVIGASEAAIIMGDNRYKGRQQLIDEKLGNIQPFSGNEFTREGQRLEGPARVALEKKFKESLFPTIIQDATEPFLAASLDAINAGKNQVYEIKCGPRTYESMSIRKKVPSHYVAQIQHMLMITHMESLIFAVYRPNKPLITLEVPRNDSYIKELRKKEKHFIKELESYGHNIQYEFRGYKVGDISSGRTPKVVSARTKRDKPAWRLQKGLLQFWDGSDYLVGSDGAGFYELNGENHYWDGEQWSRPNEIGFYSIKRKRYFWNGIDWE
jgi:putative phage-type endonuclease